MTDTKIMPCPTEGCDGICKMKVGSSGLWGQLECQRCGYRSSLNEDPSDAIYDHHRRCELVRLGKLVEAFKEKPPFTEVCRDEGDWNEGDVKFNEGVRACLDFFTDKESGE